jgi:hypothetical protein
VFVKRFLVSITPSVFLGFFNAKRLTISLIIKRFGFYTPSVFFEKNFVNWVNRILKTLLLNRLNSLLFSQFFQFLIHFFKPFFSLIVKAFFEKGHKYAFKFFTLLKRCCAIVNEFKLMFSIKESCK